MDAPQAGADYAPQRVVRVRRDHNAWVASETPRARFAVQRSGAPKHVKLGVETRTAAEGLAMSRVRQLRD